MDEGLELVETSLGYASKKCPNTVPLADEPESEMGFLPPYQYESLPEGPYIRLFKIETLESTNDAEPIKISMTTRPLPEVKSKFDALSYMWGEASDTRIVETNGKRLRIRKNLFEFLLQLRASHMSDFVWADAISINQDDTSEKDHQVQQMSAIFRNCRQSRVWLGSSADRLEVRSPLDRRKRKPKEHAMSFKNSMSPYWKRLWIIQEIILPPRVVIQLQEEEAVLGTFSWTNMTGGFNALEASRTNEGNNALHELVRTYGHHKCTDHRDRVYGLLGLQKDTAIKVDYNLSRSQLFIRVLVADCPDHVAELAKPLARALEISTSPAKSPLSWTYSTPVRIPLRMEGHISHNKYFPTWSTPRIAGGTRRAHPLPHYPPSNRETTYPAFTIARQTMQPKSTTDLLLIFESTEISLDEARENFVNLQKTFVNEKPSEGEAVKSAMIAHRLDRSASWAHDRFLFNGIGHPQDLYVPAALEALLPDSPAPLAEAELSVDETVRSSLEKSIRRFEQMPEHPIDETTSSILEKFIPGCLSEAKVVQLTREKEDEIWLQISLSDLLNLIHVGVLWLQMAFWPAVETLR